MIFLEGGGEAGSILKIMENHKTTSKLQLLQKIKRVTLAKALSIGPF